jgi:hypothetical protein
MAKSPIDDPEHWRRRAEEARTLAERMKDETSRQIMLQLAADYDRLAADYDRLAQPLLRLQRASPRKG